MTQMAVLITKNRTAIYEIGMVGILTVTASNELFSSTAIAIQRLNAMCWVMS